MYTAHNESFKSVKNANLVKALRADWEQLIAK